MPAQELLGSRDDVSNHYSGPKREEDVLVVRVKDQSVDDLS